MLLSKNSFSTNQICFMLNLSCSKQVVLFSCYEGLQSYTLGHHIKMNHLKIIIIPDLNIYNLSGLLGILSSLSLMGRTQPLHLYGPRGLDVYLDFQKKYSHTNFKYVVYIHILYSGLIINHPKYRIYFVNEHSERYFIILTKQLSGTFIIQKAQNNHLFPSPLFSILKQGISLVLPDGLLLNGSQFVSAKFKGKKWFYFSDNYYSSSYINYIINSSELLY
uniref:Ribonuclease Z n=1 Tax=Wrangelia sp. TaxID=2575620 RepID=A0A4D6WYW6_9FLOR|nr:ribonuclease Z [Wrangelia sp.]